MASREPADRRLIGGAVAIACLALGACMGRTSPAGGGSGGNPEVGGGGSGGAAGAGGRGVAALDGRVLRRLGNREYDNVVRDLLGDESRPSRDFIADAYPNGYDNGSTGLTVQSDQADAFQVAAELVAARAVANLPRLLGDCATAETEPPTACVQAFLTRFPARAYRRPPSLSERGRLQALYDLGAQAGGVALGAQLVIEAVLQSPQFLYREELGAPAPGQEVLRGHVPLTPYELASALSFLMTGSLPDDTLWAAVEDGRFRTADDLRREARRLAADERARTTLRGFLHQWLATDRLPTVIKDAAMYPRFSRALADSMAGELDRFYDFSLSSRAGGGSLRTLFTSTQSFVDTPLADVYGVAPPEAGVTFAPVALDGSTRRGVLTRAGFLTVHANLDSSGPITRGVFLLDQLLCLPPPPPPANVPAAPSAADDAMNQRTTRARFQAHVANEACRACHVRIDGYGFGFEEFDGMGAHRTEENGVAVDTTGMASGLGSADGPFTGVSELAERLVASPQLRACFLRQVYRFAMGRVETTADRPLLDALGATFSADTPLPDLLLALVEQPAFAQRRAPTTDAGVSGGGP